MALQFRINMESWKHLKELRKWRHPITDLAKRTQFGKSYCSQVINGGLAVSHDFMAKYIEVAGANPDKPEEWSALFDVVRDYKSARRPFQKDNYAKMRGEKPYVPNTVFGLARTEDRARNLDRLNSTVPIPAVDYYQDAMPKRFRMANRYGKNS